MNLYVIVCQLLALISPIYTWRILKLPKEALDANITLGPPRNVTVIKSGTSVLIQWREPDLDDQESVADPDEAQNMDRTHHKIGLDGYDRTIENGTLRAYLTRTLGVLNKAGITPNNGFLEKLQFRAIQAGTRLKKYFYRRPVPVLPLKPFVRPRSQAVIVHYVVVIWPKADNGTNGEEVDYQVGPNLVEMRIPGLNKSTMYEARVDAVYVNNVTVSSEVVAFTTFPDNNLTDHDNVCLCDRYGQADRTKSCDMKKEHPCDCRNNYKGMFCEMCGPSHYRMTPNLPCHPCPCNKEHSSGDCRISPLYNRRRGVWCTECKQGYTGLRCHRCDLGYYPRNGYCALCKCNNHQNRTAFQVCSMDKGICLNCIHNTTGDHCERCLPGYMANHTGNCVHHSEMIATLSKGTIAAIVVMTIIILSVIAGLFVYRRYKTPIRRQFWTVEVRGNPEGVSFNDLVDEVDGQGKQLEDLTFKKPSRKDYALLSEDM